MGIFFFLGAITAGAAVLGVATILRKGRAPGSAGAILGAILGSLLCCAVVAWVLGMEEINFTVWSMAVLLAVLGFLAGRVGFRAASRLYLRDLKAQGANFSPSRYLAQSLFAWVLFFELPVMLLAGLYRGLKSAGLFQ